jgi:hypothetical protein
LIGFIKLALPAYVRSRRHFNQQYLSGFLPRGLCHQGRIAFFDHQARDLVQPNQSLFFLTILLNSHGRQAGTGSGRAGIVHYFAISFTLSARFFFFFFSILSQLYIRPDIEIKQTSSSGRPLFSLASLLLQLFILWLGQPIDLHREKMCVG